MKLITFITVLIFTSNAFSQPIEPLISNIEGLLEKQNIPGAMLTIVRKDSVLFTGGIGYANMETKEKVSKLHLFRLGSVSKSFTALAILRLVKTGQLNLTDPILHIDPTLPITNNWQSETPITIAHLLEHTAGFDDMHFHSLYNKEDKSSPSLRKVLLKHRTSLTSRWKPGTRMSYSNVGYVLAGHIIEHVSGMPFDEFVRQEVFNPLGMMSSAFYYAPPTSKKPRANGYKYKNGNYKVEPYLRMNIAPAGSLCSNANDMEKFLQFLLKNEESIESSFLNKDLIKRMENPETNIATKAGLPYGYGLANSASWIKGYTFYGHNGGIDGFGADYKYSREADLGIAISVNRLVSPKLIINEIYDYLIETEKHVESRKIKIIPKEIREAYQGFYTEKSPRHQLHVFIDQVTEGINLEFGNEFVIKESMFGDSRDTLWYAGENQFYFKNMNKPTNILLENAENIPVLWANGRYYQKSSKPYYWLRFIVISLSLISIGLYLIYGTIWGLINIWKKNRQPYFLRLILWLACLGFVLIPFGLGLTILNMTNAGEINIGGLSIFLGSLMFFAFSIISVFLSFKQKNEPNLFRGYYGITSVLNCILSFYLLKHNVIGFMMWNY